MDDLRKAAEMALETLETTWGNGAEGTLKQWEETIQALRQALDDKPAVKTYAGGKPNYCTPEETRDSSSWVGLTDKEWYTIWRYSTNLKNAIEEKLREKNT